MRSDLFVTVDNLAAIVSLLEALLRNPGMGAAFGRWGLGKSTLIEWCFTNIPCFRVLALAIWESSRTTMVEDLLKCYRVESRGRLKHDFRELVRIARKHRLPLFIDEADRIVRKSALIDIIRDLHDLAGIPIILVGSENLISLLQRHDMGPVYSRISEIMEFKELSVSDVQRISSELCDLKCSENVASTIRTITLGDFRLLKAFLVKAEEICSFQKTREINSSIAQACSSVVAFREELRGIKARKRPDAEAVQQLRAVNV